MCFIIMPFSVESLNSVYVDFGRQTLTDNRNLRSERGDDLFGSDAVMDDIPKSIRKAGIIIAAGCLVPKFHLRKHHWHNGVILPSIYRRSM